MPLPCFEFTAFLFKGQNKVFGDLAFTCNLHMFCVNRTLCFLFEVESISQSDAHYGQLHLACDCCKDMSCMQTGPHLTTGSTSVAAGAQDSNS